MKKFLTILYIIILCITLGVVVNATISKNIFDSGPLLMSDPWGIATLIEAYLAFLTFYVWVFYKEESIWTRILWFFFIMGLGNVAIAIYMLIQISRWEEEKGIKELVSRSVNEKN